MVALNTRWITWLALLVVMSFLVTCSDSTVDRVPDKELRERPGIEYNLGTTAKQVAMVWACVAKRRH